MLNIIWIVLLCVGIVAAACTGNIAVVTESALNAGELGVKTGIQLMGVMGLWMGLMRLAQKAGIVKAIARVFGPLLAPLFPDLKRGSDAWGAIVMNLCANILGLGNAATPFGLKAMQEMQKENPHPERASRSMITFLALNTSCITLVPATIIGIRISAGSAQPTEIIGTTLFATCCAMICAIAVDWLFRRRNPV
ncbi:MAG: spore maturation protein [Peptococcaceae bacterium]|jgi:spore maturation protein A|nr:spore maturation protein [Peptococcaceae bacterium]MDR2736032.1 spore maturation protein [Gracilibacteraceae bacterium]